MARRDETWEDRRDDRRDDKGDARLEDRRDDRRDDRRARDESGDGNTPLTLIVRNLSYDVRSHELSDLFVRYGEIKDVYIPKDYYSGRQKGFAFIKFHNKDAFMRALDESQGITLGDRELKVEMAKDRRKSSDEMRQMSRNSRRDDDRRDDRRYDDRRYDDRRDDRRNSRERDGRRDIPNRSDYRRDHDRRDNDRRDYDRSDRSKSRSRSRSNTRK